MIVDGFLKLFRKRTAANVERRVEEKRKQKEECDDHHGRYEQTYTDLNAAIDELAEISKRKKKKNG